MDGRSLGTRRSRGSAALLAIAGMAALAAFGFLAVKARDVVFPWVSLQGKTTDATPVEVTLKGGPGLPHPRLRLPRTYLTYAQTWDGGLQEGIAIETVYPTMEPLALRRVKALAPGEVRVRFWLQAGYDQGMSKVNASDLKNFTYERHEKRPDGLVSLGRRRANPALGREWIASFLEYFYLPAPEGKANPPIFLQCGLNPGTACVAYTDFAGDVSGNYLFAASDIDRWPEIDRAARAFVDSLRVQQ